MGKFLAQATSTGINSPTFKAVGNKFFKFAGGPGAARDGQQLVVAVIDMILFFAAGVAVIFLVMGGYQYVAARGNEEATEKAKKTITSAVIGIVVIVMAFALVAIVNTLLTRGPEGQAGPETGRGPSQVSIAASGLPASFPPSSKVEIAFTAAPSDSYTWDISPKPSGWLKWTASPPKLSGTAPADKTSSTWSFTVSATTDGKTTALPVTINIKPQEEGIPEP